METIKDRIKLFCSNVKKALNKKEIAFISDFYIFKFDKLGAYYKGLNDSTYRPILNNNDAMIYIYENLEEINKKIVRELK